MSIVESSQKVARSVEGKLHDKYACIQLHVEGSLDLNFEYVTKEVNFLMEYIDKAKEKGKLNIPTHSALKVRIMAVQALLESLNK